jgi:uncharacterized membrane protein YeiB
MTASSTSSVSPDHPSQRRREVGPFRLAFGLLAAPLAWSADELFSYGAASLLCRMKASGSGQTLAVADSPWFLALIVVTLVIAVAGFVVALDNWRKTRGEQAGSGHHLPQLGEGRSRFAATCGLLTSGGFLVAFLFMLANLILAPLCGK